VVLLVIGAASGVLILLVGALMIGLLLPALGAARETARSIKTQVHLQRIGQAMSMYALDNGGRYPEPGADITQRLAGYLAESAGPGADVWVSPRAGDAPGESAFIVVGISGVGTPGGDEADGSAGPPLLIENPLLAGRTVAALLRDGSVKPASREDAEKMLRTSPQLFTQTGAPWTLPPTAR